jgi:hypothetical protein
LVFYEVPAGWFDRPGGVAGGDESGPRLLSRLPLARAASTIPLEAPPLLPALAATLHLAGAASAAAASPGMLPRAVLVLATLRACAAGEELLVDYGASVRPDALPQDARPACSIARAAVRQGEFVAAKNAAGEGLPAWCVSPWVGSVAAAHGLGRSWKILGLPPPL